MTQLPERAVSRAGSLPLVGGMLALDLCNTSSGRDSEAPVENLGASQDVLAWMQHAGVLDAIEAGHLGRRLASDPSLGSALITRVLEVRQTVYELGGAIADRRPVPHVRLDHLAEIHGQCIGRAKLAEQQTGRFVWAWDPANRPIDATVGPIVLSALELLTQTERLRVKRCHGHACGWLFLDTTKNNSRRWCDMEVCGNRAKQKRHQRRRFDEPRIAEPPP